MFEKRKKICKNKCLNNCIQLHCIKKSKKTVLRYLRDEVLLATDFKIVSVDNE